MCCVFLPCRFSSCISWRYSDFFCCGFLKVSIHCWPVFAILFDDNLWVLQHVLIAAVNSVWRTIIISCSFIVVLELQSIIPIQPSVESSGICSSHPRNLTLPKVHVSYLKPYAGIKSNYTAFYSGLVMALISMTKYTEERNRKNLSISPWCISSVFGHVFSLGVHHSSQGIFSAQQI